MKHAWMNNKDLMTHLWFILT